MFKYETKKPGMTPVFVPVNEVKLEFHMELQCELREGLTQRVDVLSLNV